MGYLWMKPAKKRRQLFADWEYEQSPNIEDAFWMMVQETKFFAWLP